MKPLPTLLALLISLVAFGQESPKSMEQAEFKRLLVGVNFSPDYCYRTLKNNDGSTLASQIIDWRNNTEGPKFGYTTGLNLCYNLSKHLGFEVGVQYSNKGYEFKKADLVYGDAIDPRYGFVYPTNTGGPTQMKFVYDYLYLDVPLRVIYSFGEKRMHFVTSIGITTNFLLNSTITGVSYYENGDTKRVKEKQQYDFNNIDISPTLSFGIDYKISNKFNLRVEPTIRYGMLKIIDMPVTAYLWNAGLNFSCYYAIK